MEWPKITIFGDSITRRCMDPDTGCWGSLISYKVGEFFQVDARGFSGYNTRWALEKMETLFPKSYLDKVEIFIPFFGHNDSWIGNVGLGIPVEEYEENYRKMIKYLNDNGVDNKKIIMITPAWYHKEAAERFWVNEKELENTTQGKTMEHAAKFSEAILRVAKENNIEVIDFYKVTVQYENLEALFCDGIHLSRLGAKILYDLLMPVIEKKITATHGKPLAELYHLIPWYQQPLVVKALEASNKSKS